MMKPTVLLLLCALPLPCLDSGCVAAEKPSEIKSFRRSLEWTDPASGARISGLEVTELNDAISSSRILAETSEGGRLVLSYSDSPRQGFTRYRIEDEATAWWAEAEIRSGLKLAGNFDPDFVSSFAKREEPVTLTIDAKGFAPVEIKTTTWQSIPWDDLLDRLKQDAVTATKLKESIPRSVYRELLSLRSVANMTVEPSSTLASFRPLLEVLASALTASEPRGYDPFGSTEWKVEASKPRRGTRVEQAAEREFARRFRLVNAEDPLSGSHIPDIEAKEGNPRAALPR